MKKVMVFCIPAHGHHNPILPVVTELVKRGNAVRYYSFEEFREKIEKTGAEFFPCDVFLPELTQEEEQGLKRVSTTEMTVVDLRVTARMDGFLAEQVASFQPDVIFTDSVCFWGKLTARKYKIPMVVSTSTFAFNQASSRYMKNSFSEIVDLITGSGRVKAELKNLEAYGYHEKSIMPLVQNDNFTDTVVYATKKYQPCAETFSEHYAFVGPSLPVAYPPDKDHERPLVFISMGTVLNEKPDFYKTCIRALAEEPVDVLISCGKAVDPESLGKLPDNIRVEPYVNQPEVLAKANAFLTHCGMNSVSESLYMAAPMVLYPQTNEQRAVARRAFEMGAGVELKGDSPEEIRAAVLTVLKDPKYARAAAQCSRDFREAPGPKGAAEFIETAPHLMPEEDKKQLRKQVLPGILQLIFWLAAIPLIILLPKLLHRNLWWFFAIIANLVFIPFKNWTMRTGK